MDVDLKYSQFCNQLEYFGISDVGQIGPKQCLLVFVMSVCMYIYHTLRIWLEIKFTSNIYVFRHQFALITLTLHDKKKKYIYFYY